MGIMDIIDHGCWMLLTMLFCYLELSHCGNDLENMPFEERLSLRNEAAESFYHAYDNYMEHAFPADELKPLSCTPRTKKTRGSLDEALGFFSLTLIDSLDTLCLLGNDKAFAEAVRFVAQNVTFDKSVVVSVFETNIRVIGGLLSAHLLLTSDEDLARRRMKGTVLDPEVQGGKAYSGELLEKAVDVADRLMKAFSTPTKIPYARINLKEGVVPELEKQTCVAGAGTLINEFSILSRLTGDPKYETAAYDALWALWERRSPIGLLGTLVDIFSGHWTVKTAGIGAGSDSFFEYLLKGHILLGDESLLQIFSESYETLNKYNQYGGYYVPVHMDSGQPVSFEMDSLSAFWPGLQALYGDVHGAKHVYNHFTEIWRVYNMLPEVYNIAMKSPHRTQRGYPLRPELIESTYLLHQITGDPQYLYMGRAFMESLTKNTRVKCGFAAVNNIETGKLEDRMDSYFLSETLKYLFMLFDEAAILDVSTPSNATDSQAQFQTYCNSSLIHSLRCDGYHYVLSTEGHFFPVLDLFRSRATSRSSRILGFTPSNSSAIQRCSTSVSAWKGVSHIQRPTCKLGGWNGLLQDIWHSSGKMRWNLKGSVKKQSIFPDPNSRMEEHQTEPQGKAHTTGFTVSAFSNGTIVVRDPKTHVGFSAKIDGKLKHVPSVQDDVIKQQKQSSSLPLKRPKNVLQLSDLNGHSLHQTEILTVIAQAAFQAVNIANQTRIPVNPSAVLQIARTLSPARQESIRAFHELKMVGTRASFTHHLPTYQTVKTSPVPFKVNGFQRIVVAHPSHGCGPLQGSLSMSLRVGDTPKSESISMFFWNDNHDEAFISAIQKQLGKQDKLKGSIVMMRRGTCTFVEKFKAAQRAGASGLIIVDSQADFSTGHIPMFSSTKEYTWPTFQMSSDGSTHSLNLPNMLITHTEGNRLLRLLSRPAGVFARIVSPPNDMTVNINTKEKPKNKNDPEFTLEGIQFVMTVSEEPACSDGSVCDNPKGGKVQEWLDSKLFSQHITDASSLPGT